ncbi:hypothetical protein D3C80_1750970 [compost metagenome]
MTVIVLSPSCLVNSEVVVPESKITVSPSSMSVTAAFPIKLFCSYLCLFLSEILKSVPTRSTLIAPPLALISIFFCSRRVRSLRIVTSVTFSSLLKSAIFTWPSLFNCSRICTRL